MFSNVDPRLGGLHKITIFSGCVGKLMIDSGQSEILKHAFGSVKKMLYGKKFPQNVRACTVLTAELLRKRMSDVETNEHLDTMLTDISNRSDTAKLWVDCYVRPTPMMMIFIRAERRSDWPLHMLAASQIIACFFSPYYVIYARYGLFYLRSMKSLQKRSAVIVYAWSAHNETPDPSIINKHLNWTSHVDTLSAKLSTTIGILNTLKHALPINIMRTIYNSLIVCHLNYGVLLWDPKLHVID